MGTNFTRLSYDDSDDSLGTEAVRRVAAEIKRAVSDPQFQDQTIFKIARAVRDRKISPARVGELCDVVEAKRKAKALKTPGAYFVTAIKREFAKAGIAWDAATEGWR